MRAVRFNESDKPEVIFTFPLDALIASLEENSYTPDDTRLLQWLREQVAGNADRSEIQIPQWAERRMVYRAADMLQSGAGTAFCPKCNHTYDAATIRMEEWGYRHGPLFGGGGRRFWCTQNHELLNVRDWIS